jgi:hypothetical protein
MSVPSSVWNSIIADPALAKTQISVERNEVLSHLDEGGQGVEAGHDKSVRASHKARFSIWT